MGTDTTERLLANDVSEGFSKNEVFILRINPNRKVAFYVHALILYSLFLLGTFGQQPFLDYLEKSSEAEMVEELLPSMRELAQQGKPAAAVWLLKQGTIEKTDKIVR